MIYPLQLCKFCCFHLQYHHLTWQRKTAAVLLIGLSVGENSSAEHSPDPRLSRDWLIDQQANSSKWMLSLFSPNENLSSHLELSSAENTLVSGECLSLDALSQAALHKNSNLRWPTTLNLSKHGVSLGFRSWGHNNISGFSQQNQSHDAPTLPYSFFLFNREPENKADCLRSSLRNRVLE